MKLRQHSQFRDGAERSVPRHGGTIAKDWRRKVANTSTKPPSTTFRTLALPIELSLPCSEFRAADSLYNTIEGFGPGSLGNLLITAHLAGLSLFQNQATAQATRQAAAFPTAQFQSALRNGMGIDLPTLTPAKILNLFQSSPRKNPSFTAEEIASRIHTSCLGKRMDDKTDASLRDVLMLIGQAATEAATDYKDLQDKGLQALSVVGKRLRELSPLFPTLEISLREESIGLSLAYEGKVDPVPEGESREFLLHHIVACLIRANPDAGPAAIQDALLSFSNNALSQLFGVLLFDNKGQPGYLKTVGIDEFCRDTGIPPSRRLDAEAFLNAAKDVPAPPLFVEQHYGLYRPAVAGKLRSWVSNYLNRLETLAAQMSAMGGETVPEESPGSLDEILSGLDLSVTVIHELMAERQRLLAEAQMSLGCLRGKGTAAPPFRAAATLQQQLKAIGQIHGTFQSVLNQIEQRLSAGQAQELQAWKAYLSVADADIFVLPRISGGSDSVEQTLAELNSSLRLYFSRLTTLASFVTSQARGDLDSIIAAFAEQERVRSRGAVTQRILTPEQVEELARRRFLQSVYRLTTRLSSDARDVVLGWLEAPLSAGTNKKNFNRLRFNNQGRLYKSPWSPGRHQPLPIDWDRFAEVDWLHMIGELSRCCAKRLADNPNGSAFQDQVEVQRFVADLEILRCPPAIDRASLLAAVPLDDLDLHPKLKLALRDTSLSRATLSSLVAWLGSQLAKLRFAARRERFIVRHKFSRVGQDDLLLVAKDKLWSPPQTYFVAKGGIARALEAAAVSPNAAVNAAEIFAKVAALAPSQTGPLLQQIPHDWYLPLDLRSQHGMPVEGLPVGKDTVRALDKVRRMVQTKGARISGPSSFLTQFSQMLSGTTECGEWMLILDWGFRSRLDIVDGYPALAAELLECNPRVAIPIKRLRPPEDSISLNEHIVAIDLGERQIGYAVFSIRDSIDAKLPLPLTDVETGQAVNGTIRVPGVRGLINAVKVHRGTQSANAKLRQNYDRRLEELRESVAAEIIQRIETLMARYSAFPILESSVVNFQTGSRQLDLVYGDVVRHFTFSGVDAHKTMRQQHWMGGDRWEHPYLMAREYDEQSGKRSGKLKPLSLFPGAAVNPAGTSQTCVHCGRNPLSVIREMSEPIHVGADGRVETPIGTIRLLVASSYSAAEFNLAARQKRNLPMNVPAKAGTVDQREAVSLVRRTMRQRPPSAMSRDTTQSQYHCLFVECDVSYHADAGAAINIGRRFLKERVDVDATRQQLAMIDR